MPRQKPPKLSPGLKQIHATEGLISAIARRLRISRQAVSAWKAVPLNRVVAVENITGIDRERLRPDIYRLIKRRV